MTIQFTEMLLKKSGTLKDYEKAQKLFSKYLNLKAKSKDTTKIMEDLLVSLKSSDESLSRVIRVYEAQANAIKNELKDDVVADVDTTSYLAKLKEYLSQTKAMLFEVAPNYKSKEEPKKPVQETPKEAAEPTAKPSLADLIESAADEIAKKRADLKKRVKEEGYTDKDIAAYLDSKKE